MWKYGTQSDKSRQERMLHAMFQQPTWPMGTAPRFVTEAAAANTTPQAMERIAVFFTFVFPCLRMLD